MFGQHIFHSQKKKLFSFSFSTFLHFEVAAVKFSIIVENTLILNTYVSNSRKELCTQDNKFPLKIIVLIFV